MRTAKVIAFPTPQIQPIEPPKEVRVADCDDGYTRLANDLYEELIGADLTRNQAKVAHAICRKTYGFNKKSDRVSDSQLSVLTKLPRQKVNKAKNELIAMNVIVRIGHEIGPNKNLSEWKIDCHQNSDNVTKTVTKSVTKTVTRLSPKQGHTKDTLKDNKEKEILKTHGAKQADAVSAPASNEIKIPPDAAIHEQRGKTLKWGTAEDLRCAEWFIETRAKAFTAKGLPTPKSPSVAGWANDIRLMRTTDRRNHADMCHLFAWVCKTGRELEFCQSPATLRDKWDNLHLRKANAERGVTSNQRPLSNIAAAQIAAQAMGVSYDDNEPL